MVKDPAGNKKLDKSKTSQKIDPIIAAVMAAFAFAEGADNEISDISAMIG